MSKNTEVKFDAKLELERLRKDVNDIARAVNTHARLLEHIVNAHDQVVTQYFNLIRTNNEEKTPK